MEEKQRNFKNIKELNTNTSSTMGKSQPTTIKESPVVKGLIDIGLTEANMYGEADIAKKVRNPKGAGKKPKARDKTFYHNHKFIEIENKVTIVLKPDSRLELSNYTEFINATESKEFANDIVDILPPIYDLHYKLIANVNTRPVIGSKVIVNFKYRSTIDSVNLEQKQPKSIKDIKFKNLDNMTVLVAYLDNKDFYPINELDLYVTD